MEVSLNKSGLRFKGKLPLKTPIVRLPVEIRLRGDSVMSQQLAFCPSFCRFAVLQVEMSTERVANIRRWLSVLIRSC